MKATVVDLRYKMNDILKALNRNETVTVLYHGKPKGIITPIKRQVAGTKWACPELVEGSCRSEEQTKKTSPLCISRSKRKYQTATKKKKFLQRNSIKGQMKKKIKDHPFFGMLAKDNQESALDDLSHLRKPRYNDI